MPMLLALGAIGLGETPLELIVEGENEDSFSNKSDEHGLNLSGS